MNKNKTLYYEGKRAKQELKNLIRDILEKEDFELIAVVRGQKTWVTVKGGLTPIELLVATLQAIYSIVNALVPELQKREEVIKHAEERNEESPYIAG